MLATALSLGRLVTDAAKMLFPDNKDVQSAANAANAAGNTYNLLTQHSITQSAGRTLVSPMVGIDKTILHAPFMGPVLQLVMARDIQAVLSHIAIKNAESMGVKIDEVLGAVQPRRAGLVSLQGCEAIQPRGPAPSGKPKDKESVTVEDGDRQVTINGKSYTEISEYTPLGIGRVVEATVNGPNGTKVPIPITFRETPMQMSPKTLLNIFSAAKVEDGLFARLIMREAKEIDNPEFFTGRDLIKRKFNIRNDDLSGYYAEMDKRDRANKMAALRTGVFSMNTMANTFILSQDTANQISLQLGKRFTNYSGFEALFKVVKASRIVICDERTGNFTFATNGDSFIEELTLREMEQKAKKAEGSDSLEALTRLLLGK